VLSYLRDPTFSRFDTISECDRQPDRHTTTAYTALSIAVERQKTAKRRITQIMPHDGFEVAEFLVSSTTLGPFAIDEPLVFDPSQCITKNCHR